MTKTINTITSLVSNALNAAHAYSSGVEGIRTALKGQLSPEEVRTALLEPVAAYYKVPVLAKLRGEGDALCEYIKTIREDGKVRTVRALQADEGAVYVEGFEAAKKAHQRLVKDVLGKSVSQSEELAVPAHIAKLAAQLVAAAAEYEGAAKLIATAIANAKVGK